ncbi:MAG: divergent polysaccharide deacetylase family protein, partial [Paracoccaceae bacterium]
PETTTQVLPILGAGPTVGAEPGEPAAPVAEGVPETDFSSPTLVDTPSPAAVAPETEGDDVATDGSADTTPGVADPGNAIVVDRTKRAATVEITESAGSDATDEDMQEAIKIGPAIEQFAQEFDNPEGRPLMAIILLVDGDDASAAIPTAQLPFPVSYVVDASKDNATAIMAAYRSIGNEVIALAPLPAGAAPKDVEVAFSTYLLAIPEAVAVMDVPDAVFQSGRAVATQVAEVLAASGHGMITYSRGLNAATQVAERAGVPAALVFRVFDANDRDKAAIKRFLDQAAFRAGQQTGVILVGHNRADTVAALLEWRLGNRASTVALAPVSAVLLAQ